MGWRGGDLPFPPGSLSLIGIVKRVENRSLEKIRELALPADRRWAREDWFTDLVDGIGRSGLVV